MRLIINRNLNTDEKFILRGDCFSSKLDFKYQISQHRDFPNHMGKDFKCSQPKNISFCLFNTINRMKLWTIVKKSKENVSYLSSNYLLGAFVLMRVVQIILAIDFFTSNKDFQIDVRVLNKRDFSYKQQTTVCTKRLLIFSHCKTYY